MDDVVAASDVVVVDFGVGVAVRVMVDVGVLVEVVVEVVVEVGVDDLTEEGSDCVFDDF